MVMEILLSRAGFDLAGGWRDLLSAQALQLRAAGVWWVIAGSAFIVGAVVAAALSRLPLPWRRLRLLRWILGAAVVYALADIGHSAAMPAGRSAGMALGASLAALGAAALMALFGAYFTIRR